MLFDSADPHYLRTTLRMASIKPHKDGYRAQVYVNGERDSKTFRTKREASAWASSREVELREDAKKPLGKKHTLLDALRKYGEEVSPNKKGERWESVRLVAFEKSLPVDLLISDVTPYVLSQWRDQRMKIVTAGSVIREFSLLSHVFETARREWGWIESNPATDVRRPAAPPHRDTVITRPQIRIMLRVMGYQRGPVRSVSHACACAFLIALRTGMRAGEICSLPWTKVYSDYATVDGKTGIRDVSLTARVSRVIEQLRGWDSKLVVGLKPATLDAMFRKYRAKAGLEGFTFHDSRHTAATWLAPRLSVLDLCKMFGWTNPKMAMIYYNPTASDITKRLSAKPAPSRPVQ